MIDNILQTHYDTLLINRDNPIFANISTVTLYISDWKIYKMKNQNINRIFCEYTTSEKTIFGHLDWDAELNSYVISDIVSDKIDLHNGQIYVNTLPKGELNHTNYRKIVNACLEVDNYPLWLLRQHTKAKYD